MSRGRVVWGVAAAFGALLLLATLWTGDEDRGAPMGLERDADSSLGAVANDAPELAAPNAPSTGERTPAEAAAPEPASTTTALEEAAEPEAHESSSRWLVFCDGAPATDLEFRLPGGYDRRAAPTSTDARGRVANWPEGETTPWLRLAGTVLGSGSGNGTHTTVEPGAIRLGLRRLLFETAVPAGVGSRRVKLTASMADPDSGAFHRSVTSIGADSGPASYFAPCDRAFTVEASIERAGPQDADYYGTLHVSAGARSDVILPITLVATYRGTLRVVAPSDELGTVTYTLTCTEPHGRYRKKGLVVGQAYEVPPGEYTVRIDVDALAARNTDQVLAETALTCSVGSGVETQVPLRFEPGGRIRVRAAPGAYVLRGAGSVVDLQHGRRFEVQLLRDGTSLIPTRWFRGEVPVPVTCKAGDGPFDSSALRRGVVHVAFRLGRGIVGEPVAISLGPGEVVEVVMPAQ